MVTSCYPQEMDRKYVVWSYGKNTKDLLPLAIFDNLHVAQACAAEYTLGFANAIQSGHLISDPDHVFLVVPDGDPVYKIVVLEEGKQRPRLKKIFSRKDEAELAFKRAESKTQHSFEIEPNQNLQILVLVPEVADYTLWGLPDPAAVMKIRAFGRVKRMDKKQPKEQPKKHG
jgi:hypothetical protein